MAQYLARLILKRLLASGDLKAKVMAELKALAAKSDTTIDDDAVKVFDEIWDVVVPILIGKL